MVMTVVVVVTEYPSVVGGARPGVDIDQAIFGDLAILEPDILSHQRPAPPSGHPRDVDDVILLRSFTLGLAALRGILPQLGHQMSCNMGREGHRGLLFMF